MFAPPPVVKTEVFARLPDELRKSGYSEFVAEQPGHLSSHSILEGPSFDLEGNLYCVDIAYGRIFRVDPHGNFKVIAEYDGEPTGLKIHKDGRMFVTDFKNGLVVVDPERASVKPFLQRVHLERLKAANDLVFASNGDIYFTDQGMTGWHDATGRLFRVRADGRIDCLLDNIPSPNGVVLDPSEEMAFVAVTRANAIWRVPLMHDGRVSKVGTFIQLSGGAGPDGLAMDEAGSLAIAHVGLGVVWLFSQRGEPIARIESCEGTHTTNVAYGGPDRRTLYITESTSGSILRAKLDVPGRKMFSHM